MQNTVSNYINTKVINIKSELLFREAEDDFFYFGKINSAIKKLTAAIDYTPFHMKSINLLADICYIKGNIKKALALYLIANSIKSNDCRILASVANCYFSLKNFEAVLKYCDEALLYISDNNELFSQIVEIKINALTELNRYDEAYKVFKNSDDILKRTLLKEIYSSINERIRRYKKLQLLGLKIV